MGEPDKTGVLQAGETQHKESGEWACQGVGGPKSYKVSGPDRRVKPCAFFHELELARARTRGKAEMPYTAKPPGQ